MSVGRYLQIEEASGEGKVLSPPPLTPPRPESESINISMYVHICQIGAAAERLGGRREEEMEK